MKVSKNDAFENGVLWKKFLFSTWPSILKSMIKKINSLESNYSPPVFSFLLSLTERLLIAWLRINKNSWYKKTVSFREEYERSKMITGGKIEHSAKCCFSILLKPFQRVKHLNSSIFWKTVLQKAFLSCIRWWILGEIFENNPFKFVTNNGKGFSMDVVSRTSFMILLHLSLNYSV